MQRLSAGPYGIFSGNIDNLNLAQYFVKDKDSTPFTLTKKPCSIRNRTGRMSGVFSVRENVLSFSPTPVSALEFTYEIAKKNGLRYVYIGNVPGHIYNSTYCPFCNRRIIHRTNFDILEMNVMDGNCKFCNSPIEGKWE